MSDAESLFGTGSGVFAAPAMPLASPALAGALVTASWAFPGNLQIGISKRGPSQGRQNPPLGGPPATMS
jgi:hypothetical protein